MNSPSNHQRLLIAYISLLAVMLGLFAIVVFNNDWPPIVTIVGIVVVFLGWIVLGLVSLLGFFLGGYGRAGRAVFGVTLAALILAAGSFVWSCFAQKRTVDAIWQARGSVKFSDYSSVVAASDAKRVDRWIPYLSRVVEANVPATKNQDLCRQLSTLNDLEKLKLSVVDGSSAYSIAKLPKLERLVVWFRNDPDPGFAYIARLPQLEELVVNGDDPVTDAGLAHLANLSKLESIEIYPSAVSDQGVEQLAHLKLVRLHLDGSRITDKSLQLLEQMPLLDLWVRKTGITNEGIQRLRKKAPAADVLPSALPSAPEEAKVVERLLDYGFQLTAQEDGRVVEAKLMDLKKFEIADSGETVPSSEEICRLAGQLPELRALTLWHLKATAPCLKQLAGLGKLEQLTLLEADVGDDELPLLSSFSNLKSLNLLSSPVTNDGLASLARLPKLANLSLTGTKVSDAGLPRLAEFPALKEVQLGDTQVTPEGIEQLRKSSQLTIPEIQIW